MTNKPFFIRTSDSPISALILLLLAEFGAMPDAQAFTPVPPPPITPIVDPAPVSDPAPIPVLTPVNGKCPAPADGGPIPTPVPIPGPIGSTEVTWGCIYTPPVTVPPTPVETCPKLVPTPDGTWVSVPCPPPAPVRRQVPPPANWPYPTPVNGQCPLAADGGMYQFPREITTGVAGDGAIEYAIGCIVPSPIPTPAPTPKPTPAPTACSTSENDDEAAEHNATVAPTITAPARVLAHAGQQLTLAVTAFDCADRPVNIKAKHLPEGASIENGIDAELRMPKAVVTWTPDVNAEGRTIKIPLIAVASDDDQDDHKKLSSSKTVIIQVLPAVQAQSDNARTVVNSNTISSARYNTKSKKVELSGQVAWDENSSQQDRQAAITEETAVITDATTNARLGSAQVTVGGKWKANLADSPCSIDVTFQGKTASKAVRGIKNCR